MAEVEIKEHSLIVHIKGIHKLLALRNKLEVPLSSIVDSWVGVDPQTQQEFKHLWRLPGSYLPGVITAGRYVNSQHNQFWDVRKKQKAIVIKLQQMKPQKIIIEVADPAATVTAIKQAVARAKS